ncbi:MAG: BamA/TamA family outer membrane protein [Luteitalea sp.]|nr:BamA/TamA family outer membrane protein [Luteitalea sp.]
MAMRFLSSRLAAAVALGAAVALMVPAHASAQYFGQNKVQYDRFRFEVLKTQHFDIHYYPEEKAAIDEAARMAERWYERLVKTLDHELTSRQPLILYASHPHFEQTNVIEGGIGEGTGGVTEALKRRVVLPFAGPLAETDHVLGHELVHAFQYDIGFMMGGRGLFRLPLWFIEGMAEYLSIGPVDPQTAMWLRDAALRDNLPTIRDLNNPRYFPYRWGQALWAYVAGRWGDAVVGDALRIAAQTGDAEGALMEVTGLDIKELSDSWKGAIIEQYQPVLSKAPQEESGRLVLSEQQNGGQLNIGPSLSPDGKKIAFLSEKDLFSIDVFLADAETGKIERKIVETAADPHFDSLQFINSAGAWDHAGRHIAFAAVRRGNPVLSIYDVEQGKRVREEEFEELGEIFHPTWSPDGRRIAFSALKGGLPDLYLYDLDKGELRALTDDAYAEIQPAWSPDGKTIVFVTDRFSSNLETLQFGAYRLARLDLDTRRIEPVAAFPQGKHINPQWAQDGRSLFFLADPDGVTNVYRLEIESGRMHRVTDVRTGVTGITALSPALSVAAKADRLAYSVQFDSGFEIRTLDGSAGEVPVEISTDASQPDAAMLPPPLAARKNTQVEKLLTDASFGLPPEDQKPEEAPYDAKLGLDYAAQAMGVGASSFGTYLSGGVALQFSDILGNHILTTNILANGEVEDIGGQVAYLNRSSRLNWGLIGGSIPYRWGGFRGRTLQPDGTFTEDFVTIRQTHRQIAGLVAYPFSRSDRFEFSGGYENIAFDQEVDRFTFSPFGELLDRSEFEEAAPDDIHLASGSAAFVHDTTVFGPTSPLLGSRWRVEASPTGGSLNYTGMLLDYRRYFAPVRPITFAVRGLHYGRYGGDGDDTRLRPLFLGSQYFADPGFVRGYDLNDIDRSECNATDESGCPEFDRLIGSRILVLNAELRFPLIGIFKGQYDYGPVPIEGLLFGDAGVAWTSTEDPAFANGSRDWVRSVGAGLRFNALGFAIFELNAVRPLDREGVGWKFAFNIRPGF